MKITFVVPGLNLTGGLRVISIYADLLSRKGHKVTVVSPNENLPSLKQRIKSALNWKGYKFKPWFDCSLFEEVNYDLKVLEQYRPVISSDVPDSDVVIATWWETALWVDDFPMRKGKKVYFMQDYGCAAGQPLDKIQATWLLPFHIITISQWLMHLIVDHKHNNERLTLVPNGIDLSVYSVPGRNKNKCPQVGFLYTNAPQKGADLMIDAFLKAKTSLPELQLVMFGRKELPEKLKRMPDVTYFQKLRDDKIAEVYASCDAWLFGSVREGFGLPILEAMACRTPVIATKAGAAEELVSSKSGFLLDSNDVDEMAEKILEVANLHNTSWQTLSDGAYEVAKLHSWDIAATKFEDTLISITT